MKPVVAFRHVPREPLGTIDAALRRAGLEFHYIDLDAKSPERFDPREVSGLVVLGGPMNVDEGDQYPFLKREIGWIAATIEREVPVLGICLGSQLMAAALGARVWHSPVKEIGWYEIELTEAARHDTLLKHLRPRETVFQWHGDTFDLPTGATALARSEVCGNQAFRFGSSAWALQFHLEVTTEIIEAWLNDPDGRAELAELSYIDPLRIREATPRHLGPMQERANHVFGEFAAICQRCAD
jgi:GMP synthase (glutamine-hydrolysing)